MKICHMTSVHDSEDIRILKKECVSLAKNPENTVYFVARGECRTYKNVSIVGIGNIQGNRIKRILRTSKLIYKKALSLDADIYHFHDPELLLYAKKIKKKGKKVIFDSHENSYVQILEKEYIPKWIRKFIAKIYLIIENHACKYLDGAIFPCPYEGKHIFEGRVKNCEFINNVPMLEEMEQYKMGFDERLKDKADVACYVGSLTEDRGLEYAVDACELADVRLILGGDFDSKEFEERLKEKKQYRVVDYRGFCSREEVFEIYKESKVGLSVLLPVGQYPKAYNLPTKVYEYMMMELPFVISDFPYNRMIIDKYKCGIAVDPTNVNAITEAIRYIINNPEIADEMGKNGKKLITESLNWREEEKKLYKFYDSIMQTL